MLKRQNEWLNKCSDWIDTKTAKERCLFWTTHIWNTIHFFSLIERQILPPVRFIYLMFDEDCSDSIHFLRGGPSCAVWPSQMLCIHVVRCVSWHGKGCLDGIQLFRLHFQPQTHSWGSRPSRSPVPHTHTHSLSHTHHTHSHLNSVLHSRTSCLFRTP